MSGNNLKIAACTPVVHPGEVGANLEAVSSMIREAALCGAQLIVFPCNCLAGASCGEDILRFGFIESAVFDARREISALAAGLGVTVALDECLYAGYVSVIPAAEPELVTAQAKRRKALREFSRGRVVVWCNAGYGESTTDFVYGGGSMIWADGECLAENPRFGTGGAIIYAEVGFGAQGGCCSPLKTSATPTPPGGPLPLMVPRVAQFPEGTATPNQPDVSRGEQPPVVVAAPERQPRARKKGSALSLASLEAADEPELTLAEDPSAAAAAPAALPSDEALVGKWHEMIAGGSLQGKQRLSTALSTAKLEFREEDGIKHLDFYVTNEAQKKWIEEKCLRDLESSMQQLSGCRKLYLHPVVTPQEELPEMKYMPSEKAKDLMDKNPEVKQFVADFGLDI